MNKQEFINQFDLFCSNLELEFIDLKGNKQTLILDKLLKTKDIILSDLPFDTIQQIFVTKIEFYEIAKQYYTEFILDKSIIKEIKVYEQKPDYISSNIQSKIYFRTYDKYYINNTYLKFNDYYFFKNYFNINFENLNIFYPVKILNKKDFSNLEQLFNIDILYQKDISFNTNRVIIKDNKISVPYVLLKNDNIEMYNNYYYNFYQTCSLFNVIKFFIYGLLNYKQEQDNIYNNIPLETTEILKINETIDKTVSENIINGFDYNNISQEDLIKEIQPIPTDDMYDNEQHIILQGVFEDIQKFCNNIEKYIVGAKWEFDTTQYNDIENIDDKIQYLENILKTYNNEKLDMRGYNSYFKVAKRSDVVGDSDKLNYVNLTESENNFLHIEKMLQSNKYPLFAKLNLISQIKNTIKIYLDVIKNLSEQKKFYNEDLTEQLLPQLRDAYKQLAKAVASQEQPLSFGNPSYDDNPNENPFRQELP